MHIKHQYIYQQSFISQHKAYTTFIRFKSWHLRILLQTTYIDYSCVKISVYFSCFHTFCFFFFPCCTDQDPAFCCMKSCFQASLSHYRLERKIFHRFTIKHDVSSQAMADMRCQIKEVPLDSQVC